MAVKINGACFNNVITSLWIGCPHIRSIIHAVSLKKYYIYIKHMHTFSVWRALPDNFITRL